MEHIPDGAMLGMVIVMSLGELEETVLRPLNEQRKQEAIDLLAVQVTSKKAIIDSTDYVALGWRVDDTTSASIPPRPGDVDAPAPSPPTQQADPQMAMAGGLGGMM